MSRHEWEEGTVKIPAEAYPAVRTAVISTYNRSLDEKFAEARRACGAAREAGFRKRDFSRADWARSHHGDVAHYITKQGSDKVFLPKRKNFPHVPTSRSAVLSLNSGGVTIAFDNKNRTVFYTVAKNNHACENARRNPVVRKLFSRLHNVQNWNRGSGGEIIGNDEYNGENKDFDGGANYVTESFGPDIRGPRFNGMYFTGSTTVGFDRW